MLRYRADLRPLFFNALYFALLAGLWVAAPSKLGVAIPLYVALLVTAFQGAVQTHNAVHSPVFKQRWLNKVYQVVLTNIYGHPVSSYVPGHNLSHHKHTQSRSDVMRTSKARFRWHFLNLVFFLAQIAPSIMKADSAYAKVMRTRHPRWFRQMALEIVVLWTATLTLFVLDWRKALVLWLVPHLYAQWGIVTMNLLQHDGCDESSDYDHSRNFVSPIINWWVFNNGYHTIHHVRPGLHWSLTPAAHAAEIAPHIHPNLDQKSLLAFVWRTFLLGHRENYDGSPFVLRPEGPDEEWIPDPSATLGDLGAETLDALNEAVAFRPA